ncbi:MAG: bifunctional 4-hydroxy-2-oxoglutarate aldolase/2-dehydro-3-deoxy-phosphogluconate aldolase [Leifsonia sp.]|nr:bifunctional 4-hydroxy-2-oxoglutarate aldolase/2-dehydro-3-deoxy-phosphogluconate aldolase [Leifsonia sp.]
MADDTFDRVRASGIASILTVHDAASITDVVDALVDGGVSTIEVTLRTSAGWDAIERLGGRSDVVVGAGTVLTVEDARRAIDLGSAFVVSPGLDAAVVIETESRGALPLPGVATPTELQRALQLGLSALKLFPAEPLGGVAMLKALAGPFADVSFMPSGGVTPALLESYLAQPNVFAVGCSWLVTAELVSAGRFDEIRTRAHDAAALVAARG